MTLQLEPITKTSRFWADVNRLAREAFPPEEYLAPSTLADMAKADNFDFWALTDEGAFVGFMVVQTFAPNFRDAFLQSILLAKAAGVKEDEILSSTEDIDSFFLD